MSTYVLNGTLKTGIRSGLSSWSDWKYNNYSENTSTTYNNQAGIHGTRYLATSITFDSSTLATLQEKMDKIMSIILTLNLSSSSDSTFNLRYKCNSYVGGAQANQPWLVADAPGGTSTQTTSDPDDVGSSAATFNPASSSTINIEINNIPNWGFVIGWNRQESSSAYHYITIASAVLTVTVVPENTVRIAEVNPLGSLSLAPWTINVVENGVLVPYRATIVENNTLVPYS